MCCRHGAHPRTRRIFVFPSVATRLASPARDRTPPRTHRAIASHRRCRGGAYADTRLRRITHHPPTVHVTKSNSSLHTPVHLGGATVPSDHSPSLFELPQEECRSRTRRTLLHSQ